MRALVFSLAALSLIACAHREAPPAPAPTASSQPAAHGPRGVKPQSTEKQLSGAVTEAFDAAGYTYLRVNLDDGREIWAAATQQAITVGARVVLETSIKMENFHSKALGRTFAEIYFVNVESVGEGAPAGAEKDPAGDMI